MLGPDAASAPQLPPSFCFDSLLLVGRGGGAVRARAYACTVCLYQALDALLASQQFQVLIKTLWFLVSAVGVDQRLWRNM